jgi:hypothetical protein
VGGRQSGRPLAATNVKTAGCACKRHDAVHLGRKEGLQPRVYERPAVSCSQKLARASACYIRLMAMSEERPGRDFIDLMTILSLDLLETYERIQSDPFHQPARRTQVRTVCSQLEAYVYYTKQMVSRFEDFPFASFTDEDLVYLREEVPANATDAQRNARRLTRLPLKDNIKHLVNTTARAMQFSYAIDTGEGWTAMLATIRIRDRLVHPKRATDMIVTDDELYTVANAQDWFHSFMSDFWTKIDRSLKGLD